MNKPLGPHQNQPIIQTGTEPSEAKAALIMIHGRGASPQSMLSLLPELDASEHLLVLAPQAEGNTWYPYSFLMPTQQNQPKLDSALQAVGDAVTKAREFGFDADRIFFLGFSQGACLASEFVARNPKKYGGLFALSGGVIGDEVHFDQYSGDLNGTPVFIGCSDVDAHIPKERVDDTAKLFVQLGASVTKNIYPGMGHTIVADEIDHINRIINATLSE